MFFIKKERLALFTNLYLKQEVISKVYSFVGLSVNKGKNLIHHSTDLKSEAKVYSLSHVPNYLNTEVAAPKVWTEMVFPSIKGYAISINKSLSVDDYLRQQSKKQRENINRALRRLETCFTIDYKIFQQNIEEEEYLFLMGHLKAMIIKRFEQRNQKSDTLVNWDEVLSTSYKLIKEGKASLFVIYDKDLPIAISFNYIYGSLLFGYISSYDIDYSKFSLGQIIIYKLLEWCLDNQYTQYDMGWGDLDYKKWWCNKIYRFNHHIFYLKRSIPGFLYANLQGNKSRILAFLIAKGVNTRVNQIKNRLKTKQNRPYLDSQYKFIETIPIPDGTLEEVNMNQEQVHIGKKVINDFLFLTQEHSDDVSLYYSPTNNLYILKGKKKTKTIQFHSTNQ